MRAILRSSSVRLTPMVAAIIVATTAVAATTPAVASTSTSSVTVPGEADPWLAGMPDGSIASQSDTAPAQSPTEVGGLNLGAGGFLTFDVTGSVAFDGPIGLGDPPDGDANIVGFTHNPDLGFGVFAPENGIADIDAPANSLIGVFLGPSQPDLSPAPTGLNFNSSASRDYTNLSPVLKQPFFIGDGRTSSLVVQEVNVPTGATRLFLGPMDGNNWVGNAGSFSVDVHHTSSPGTYTFGGFRPPVDNPPVVNVGRAGRTYPLKWNVTDANGDEVTSLSVISSIKHKSVTCGAFSGDPTDALEVTATGQTELRYDGQFIYNWATPSQAGCYEVFVTLADGGVYSANFDLR